MKRFFAALLVFLLLFTLVGCKKDNKDGVTEDRGQEITAQVEKGSIPEVTFAVGSGIDEVTDYYEELIANMEEEHQEGGHVHGEDDVYYNVYEGNLAVEITTGKMSFYYEKSKKAKGISVIKTTEDAFGFKTSVTTKNEIEQALTSLNGKTVVATEDDLYFLPYAEESLVLRYNIGKYQLDFYFNENILVTTVLLNTENWTI